MAEASAVAASAIRLSAGLEKLLAFELSVR
jgi:hypothetical protein